MRNPSCGKGEIKIADILNLDEKQDEILVPGTR
jgi:hypothetical protein